MLALHRFVFDVLLKCLIIIIFIIIILVFAVIILSLPHGNPQIE
jgi:hypothetical protein